MTMARTFQEILYNDMADTDIANIITALVPSHVHKYMNHIEINKMQHSLPHKNEVKMIMTVKKKCTIPHGQTQTKLKL